MDTPTEWLTHPGPTAHPSHRTSRLSLRHIPLACLLLVLLTGVAVRPAVAQVEGTACTSALATAQTYYVEQEFAVAEVLLRECLNRPDVDEATAIQIHRLLALVYLRQDNLPDARDIVIRLLGISVNYTPDPVLDPPTYVALVESIRESLQIEREETLTDPPSAPVTEPEPTYRAARSLFAHATFGAGSYGGERGIDASWLVEEFTSNAGVSLSLGAGLSLSQTLSFAASYRLHRIPRLFTERKADVASGVRADRDDPIDPDESSKSVHLFTVLGRAYYLPQGRTTSYVELGVSSSVSRINGTTRTGFGPHGGIGLEYALSPAWAGFGSLSATLILPGDAVDHVNVAFGSTAERGSDLLSFAEFGVRYRITEW